MKDLKVRTGTSLVVQWLRLCVSSAGGVGSIPGQGTKIPHTKVQQKKKKGNNQTYKTVRIHKYKSSRP